MKTKRILIVLGIIAGIVISFNTVCDVIDTFFYNMEDLPNGKLLESVESPDGDKAASVYLIENALGTAVRCSVDDGEEQKNIYWQTDERKAEIRWLDDESILINGVTLNVTDGSYDSRKINEELDLFLNEKIF